MALMAATVMAVGTTVANTGFVDFGTENPYRAFNSWINGYFFDFFHLNGVGEWAIATFGEEGGYYLKSYIRDLVGGTFVYWVTASIWSFFLYRVYVDEIFHKKNRPLPNIEWVLDGILLAQSSLFVYASLPVISEFLIESGVTHCYFYVSDIGGWHYYFLFMALYIILVEIGVYWVHRTEHTNKFLYKYVHGLHHKYNKHETLTPFTSIAFNPLDGMAQASPYVICLFLVPCHYFTHVILLFFSGVWATNIHDAMVSRPSLVLAACMYLSVCVCALHSRSW